ncbi:hypothetical protein MKW94_015797 [Papaver nudicaule]|uniref:Uncharacterized protein n=1 Tax=Papaver nudicaule TaxID=74823 RepID=A0AA41SJ77_PAPNU|nr:hypothetical protein [Papaver nudicaule]
MAKGPGLYTNIGKTVRDLLYKDYQSDQKFSVTTYTENGVAICSSGTKKGELFLADVNTQLKQKNITADIKVDTNSKVSTIVTIDEPVPGVKAILSFIAPDQKSGKVELQYQHEHAGIASSFGLTANPVVNFSGLFGNSQFAAGTDVSFDTASGNFVKYNAGLSVTRPDLIATLALNDKCDTLNVSYYQIVSSMSNAAFGAELSHSISRRENTLTVGAHHALDQQTAVKAKLNSFGMVNALIQHEFYPKSYFTISGEVDTNSIEKSAKIGLALALKP